MKALAMRFVSQFGSVLVVGLISATPVSAQLFPFSPGYWGGYGYGGGCAPGWGGMYSSYSPVWPSYAAPMNYGVGYGAFDSGCCCSPCMDACGGACGTGCSTGSCGAVDSGSLKPAQDDNFRSGAPAESTPNATDREREFGGSRSRDERPAASDRYERDTAPVDSFEPATPRRSNPVLDNEPDWGPSGTRTPAAADPANGLGTPGSGLIDDGLFPADDDKFGPLRETNKPPMSDPLESDGFDVPAGSGGASDPIQLGNGGIDGTADDFLPPLDGTTSSRANRVPVVSRLRDVVPVERLARRSLPSAQSKPSVVQNDSAGKIRWISLPAVDGRVRL